jgi:hypothetical protein
MALRWGWLYGSTRRHELSRARSAQKRVRETGLDRARSVEHPELLLGELNVGRAEVRFELPDRPTAARRPR